MYTVGLTANLVGFSAPLLLVCALNSPSLGGLRPLARIGFYSYSIYLWHWVISKLLPTSGFVSFWSYAAISIIIGIGAAKLIESPVLQFRDRYFPSRRAVTTGQIDAESHPLELCRS